MIMKFTSCIKELIQLPNNEHERYVIKITFKQEKWECAYEFQNRTR